MKRFAIPCLVTALAFYGCSSDNKKNDAAATDGGTTADSGTTDGTVAKLDTAPNLDTGTSADTAKDTGTTADTSTADTSTADTSTADTSTADTAKDGTADTSADTSTDVAAAVSWTTCTDPKTGVSASDFCDYYMTKCGFGAVMGRTAAQSFADKAACVARYNTYNATQMGCAAYHVCVAGMAGMAATHCPHPAQMGGPCSLP